MAVGVLRGEPAHAGRPAPRVGRVLRRCARRAPTPGGRCWCSPRTPGTPTTTSAARTCTRAARRCRSPGRWRPGTCASPTDQAAGWQWSTRPTSPWPRTRTYLRDHQFSAWAGSAGWPNAELPFVALGRGQRLRPRLRRQRRPRAGARPAEGRSLYLSVGHDEYWSAGMRDTVEDFVGAGGNACFFSGNTAMWQVRHEPSSEGGPPDVMVCFKDQFKRDPVYGTDRQPLLTTMWSDHLLERPENRPDRRDVHPRRLPPHRQGGRPWQRRLHGVPPGALGVRRHRRGLRRPDRLRRRDRGL